ncbi:Hydroxyacid oxidase 1 [Halotydeus destructor]|nr:Hydroxyacid oxidase 1 [Halotydeus destructor]
MSGTMITLRDFEEHAIKYMDKATCEYYRSGANSEHTLKDNVDAFQRLRIRPRYLSRDVSVRDLSTTFLGTKVPFPIGVAPSACAELGAIMILSTYSTTTLEEVAEATPESTKWFQLYIFKDREVTRSIIRRAEKAGFKAIVVTVDAPFLGSRLADVRNKFALPAHLTVANLKEEMLEALKAPGAQASGRAGYASLPFDASLTWKDIDWICEQTKLPVVVKGVLTAEDAVLAVEHKASAIIVSNHGGRQLDGVPATIEALPEVVQAVGDRCEVYVDGGFREGTDVLKALALGARGVFVGRPALWGLSHSGKDGVKQVLEILSKEFDYALALSGCCELSHLKREFVAHRDYFAKLI